MLQKWCQEGSQGPPLEAQNQKIFEMVAAIWRPDGVPSLLGAKSGPKIAPGPQNCQKSSKNNQKYVKNRRQKHQNPAKSIKIKSELSLPAGSGQNR